jgi:hypothetical protein
MTKRTFDICISSPVSQINIISTLKWTKLNFSLSQDTSTPLLMHLFLWIFNLKIS